MTTKNPYTTEVFANLPYPERTDRMKLLADALSKINITSNGWEYIYASDRPQHQLGSMSLNGVTYHDIEDGVYDMLHLQEPAWVAKTIGITEMLSAHSEARTTNTADQFRRMLIMLEDGLNYYDLKRLTKKQKEYCINWIYDNADKYGRNRHESAAIIMEILSGQRKAMGSLSGQEPFEPTLGSVERSMRVLRWAASIFRRLGAKDMEDPYWTSVQVLQDSGASLDYMPALRKLRRSMMAMRNSKATSNFMKQLSEILKSHGVTELNLQALPEDIKKAGVVRYGYHPINYSINIMYDAAAWVRVNMSQVDMNSDEIEAFVEEILARLTKRLKSRSDRNK